MTFQEAKSHLGLSKTPSRELRRDLASPELVVGRARRVMTAAHSVSGFHEQMNASESLSHHVAERHRHRLADRSAFNSVGPRGQGTRPRQREAERFPRWRVSGRQQRVRKPAQCHQRVQFGWPQGDRVQGHASAKPSAFHDGESRWNRYVCAGRSHRQLTCNHSPVQILGPPQYRQGATDKLAERAAGAAGGSIMKKKRYWLGCLAGS